ncbi:GDSL esterase/lipase At4g16230-like [Cynara cardunculus var. scolymus]|uniref:GDSL esterase/lipase At4g16230-like n=1 Tax=Cynara cardunculus var. scolymus TaxID=59895 RepID=UPI000D62C5C9|nr:GDSL esterase/lipase At4g16230-like [Cynara cardunculus var. scolymus]
MGPVFIFGDSTVDVGTNNHLNCTARSDHPYYGIDYHRSKATGRFSNGLNPADTIVELLGGYKRSPLPFLALVEDHSNFTGAILNGVNFASGGAGLAKDIGQVFGEVISLEEQIQQFATVRGNITALLGESRGDLLLQSSMYILSIGSNDIMTYIFTHSMTPELFITNLTDTYAIHIKNLHNMGARKFGILSVAAIGCCPMARAYNGGPCGDEPNDLARAFYVSVQSLLQNFSSTLEGFKYSLGNTYNMTMNIIDNPIGSQFKDVKSACCGNTTQRSVSDCTKGVYLCPNRDEYLFWDAFHPSQAASKLAALALVTGDDPEFVSPINFSSLRRA